MERNTSSTRVDFLGEFTADGKMIQGAEYLPLLRVRHEGSEEILEGIIALRLKKESEWTEFINFAELRVKQGKGYFVIPPNVMTVELDVPATWSENVSFELDTPRFFDREVTFEIEPRGYLPKFTVVKRFEESERVVFLDASSSSSFLPVGVNASYHWFYYNEQGEKKPLGIAPRLKVPVAAFAGVADGSDFVIIQLDMWVEDSLQDLRRTVVLVGSSSWNAGVVNDRDYVLAEVPTEPEEPEVPPTDPFPLPGDGELEFFNLTDDAGWDASPSWSPDGRKIAFVSNRDGNLDIYVMGADGSNPTRLTAEDYNTSPSWSPDGTQIAFSSARAESGTAIFVMGSDGNARTRLTDWGNNDSPSWSPDGTRIAFASTPTPRANLEIYTMGADGCARMRLTDTAWNESPSWSPDGTQIAFASNRGTGEVAKFDIYVMGADGGKPTRLTDRGNNRSPSWSPDGRWIAFASDGDIYVMGSDGGGEPLNLTRDAAFDMDPVWSPDGTKIAFVSNRDGNLEIYVAALNPAAGGGGGTVGQTRSFSLPGGGEMAFVWIEPGVFQMGSPESERSDCDWCDHEGPLHEVELSRGFWLGKYEVTQGQWEAVMGSRPWSGRDYVRSNSSHPAVYISWHDVQEFIEKLNAASGSSLYRLPSEAEWEYACRAGTQTRWSFGDDEGQLTRPVGLLGMMRVS